MLAFLQEEEERHVDETDTHTTGVLVNEKGQQGFALYYHTITEGKYPYASIKGTPETTPGTDHPTLDSINKSSQQNHYKRGAPVE